LKIKKFEDVITQDFLDASDVAIIINRLADEQDKLYVHKARGKGYYIPEEDVDKFVLYTYMIRLYKQLKKKLGTGYTVRIENLVNSLKCTDWIRASYDYKYWCTPQELIRVLMIKKPKDPEKIKFQLLDKQADYLARASREIVDFWEV